MLQRAVDRVACRARAGEGPLVRVWEAKGPG